MIHCCYCCCCSVAKLYPSLCNPKNGSRTGLPVLHHLPNLLKLTSIESVMPSTISSSVTPFSSCPQSFPASGSFPMSQLFASCSQSIGASVSVLPKNIQGWYPLGLPGLISLLSKGHSRVLSSIMIQKHQFFGTQPSLWSNCHIYTWLLEKL